MLGFHDFISKSAAITGVMMNFITIAASYIYFYDNLLKLLIEKSSIHICIKHMIVSLFRENAGETLNL